MTNGLMGSSRYASKSMPRSNWNDDVDAVEAVSYTHLDVYKRQKERRFIGFSVPTTGAPAAAPR